MEFVFVCVASRYPSLTSKIASQTQVCHEEGKHDKSRHRMPFIMIILREIFRITSRQYRPVTNFTLATKCVGLYNQLKSAIKKTYLLFMVLLATTDHLPCLVYIFLLVRNSQHMFFATDTIFANCFSLNFWTFQQSLNGFGLVPRFGHQSICAVYIWINSFKMRFKVINPRYRYAKSLTISQDGYMPIFFLLLFSWHFSCL